jgi:peptidase M28-like protein
MAPIHIIERLAAAGGRLPGSEGDRRAVAMLNAELESMGRRTDLEEIRVRPAWHLTFAVFAALAAAGTVLSTQVPPAGAVLLFLVGLAMYGDLAVGFYTLRLFTPRRTTSNISSIERRESPAARVILVAHHDSGRTGMIYAIPRLRRRLRRPRRATLTSPLHLLFWATMVALVAAIVRLAVESGALTGLQFVLTAMFLTYVVLLLDAAAAAPSPGAADNASGVVAVLEAGRRLTAEPPRLIETWIVLTGAGDTSALGMREWLQQHGGGLRGVPTYFVNVKGAANGRVCHVVGEGYATLTRNDERLARLAEQAGSERHVWRLGTDASAAASHGHPALTIACLDEHGRISRSHRPTDTAEHVEPGTLDRAVDTVERLVRSVDDAVTGERERRAVRRAQP